MEIKVNQKMSILGRPRFGPFCGYFRYDVSDVTVLRLSCAKALKGHLALQLEDHNQTEYLGTLSPTLIRL